MASGRLFSIRGDLTRLRCDAWMLPTDGRLHVATAFRPAVRGRLTALYGLRVHPPPGWRVGGEARAFPLPPRAGGDGPAIWPTLVQRDRPGEDAWYAEGVAAFLEQAAAALPAGALCPGRARPLLALPVVGPVATPRRPVSPSLAATFVATVTRFLADHPDVDVAVVAGSDRSLATVRWARRATRGPVPKALATLVRHARRAGLVVVAGAEAQAAARADLPDAEEPVDLRSLLVANLPAQHLVAVPPSPRLEAAARATRAGDRILPAPDAVLRGTIRATTPGRHPLFVGFRPGDPVLARALESVLEDRPEDVHAATVLVPADGPDTAGPDAGAWPARVDVVVVEDVDTALDRLTLEASDAGTHLLDPALAPLLAPADQQLARELRSVARALESVPDADARSTVDRVLRGLGWDGAAPPPERPRRR